MKYKILLLSILIIMSVLLFAACSETQSDNSIKSVQIDAFPNNVTYKGNPIDLTGAKLLVTYADSSVKTVNITQDMISGFDKDKLGTQRVTIKYNTKFSAKIDVEVREFVLTSIAVANKLTGAEGGIVIEVEQNEKLDLSNYEVVLKFEGGFKSKITKIDANMLRGYSDGMGVGEYTVDVIYEGKSTQIKIVVYAKEFDASKTYVYTKDRPLKISYFVGEQNLDPYGMKMTLTFVDGTTMLVPYTEQNKDDFVFTYNFGEANPISKVTVTYLETYTASFSVDVKEPRPLTMNFDYDKVIEDGGGNETVVRVDGRPVTMGIARNGINSAPNPLSDIIQGETIDWASGTAELIYEYGASKIISLADSINVHIEGTYNLNEPGNYTLRLYYGNVSWRVTLNITVHPRTAAKVLLYNDAALLTKTYSHGDSLSEDAFSVRYNLLYDNAQYMRYAGSDPYTPATEDKLEHFTVNMLSQDSILRADYTLTDGNGFQTVAFVVGGLRTELKVKVNEVTVKSFTLEEPTKNFYKTGTAVDEIDLTGGRLYLILTNNKTASLELISPLLSFEYYDSDGNPVSDNFAVSGEYTVVINYSSLSVADFKLNVADRAVTRLELFGQPTSNTYISFANIDFNSMYLHVYYNDESAFETVYLNTLQESEYLYRADRMQTGPQNVVIRYDGTTVTYPVVILGKVASFMNLDAAPTKTVYAMTSSAPVLNLDGIKIRVVYNDTTERLFGADAFSDGIWDIKILDKDRKASSMDTLGEKTIRITLSSGSYVLFCEFVIFVEQSEVEYIHFDDSVLELLDAGLLKPGDPQSVRALKISLGGEINLYGLNLQVKFADSATVESIPLSLGYLMYDKGNVIKTDSDGNVILLHRIEISYGGKSSYIWFYIDAARAVVKIEIAKLPNIVDFPEFMELTLEGGVLKRTFADGEVDYYAMNDRSVTIEGYNINPFAVAAPGQESIVQRIELCHNGLSAEINITTHRKINAGKYISYLDSISFYGAVKIPYITISTSIPSFVLPDYALEYWDGSQWRQMSTESHPILPGQYPLRVRIIENDYYISTIITGYDCYIMPKYVEIKADDLTKIYGDRDPSLTYFTEGDKVNPETGEITNTVLIWNNGVQDVLEVIIERQQGESVRYDNKGVITGYTITCRLAPASAKNQNDRYNVSFISAELKIMPIQITTALTFAGYSSLYEDGLPKMVTVMYRMGDRTVIIPQEDLIYTLRDGTPLNGAPVVSGEYVVTVSQNYTVSVGERSLTFTVHPPRT